MSLLGVDPCGDERLIFHELFHVLGFDHEHSRPDRNRYVKINLQNVVDGMSHCILPMLMIRDIVFQISKLILIYLTTR